MTKHEDNIPKEADLLAKKILRLIGEENDKPTWQGDKIPPLTIFSGEIMRYGKREFKIGFRMGQNLAAIQKANRKGERLG